MAQTQRAQQLEDELRELEQSIHRAEMQGHARMRAASQKAVTCWHAVDAGANNHFPDWEQMASDAPWTQGLTCPVLPLGNAVVDQVLPDAVRIDAGGAITAPVNFEPFRDRYLTITLADPNSRDAIQLIQALLLRALTTLASWQDSSHRGRPARLGTRLWMADALG